MGKLNGKGGYPQLQSMRARLRKASCMGDDCYDDDARDAGNEGEPGSHLHPHSQLTAAAMTTVSAYGEAGAAPKQQHQQHDAQLGGRGPSEQLSSAFFARLPAEVRRMIYEAVWRSDNPLMKMHMHARCDGPQLMTTPCQYARGPTTSTRDDEADPMQTDPWPGWRGKNQPPRWFWHAWGLRLRWGPHWKCQASAMMYWNTRHDGTSEDLRRQKGGWMGVFLCCRRMYAEAIESLFESTTLIFTASEDAYRFLVQRPHAHLARLRKLDLAFTHFKDHLFLQPIEPRHPRLSDGDGGCSATSEAPPAGWELWLPLTAALRERLPELTSLRVTLSPPSARAERFVDVLRDWEGEGYGGWVTESADEVVYLEMGSRRAGRRRGGGTGEVAGEDRDEGECEGEGEGEAEAEGEVEVQQAEEIENPGSGG